MDETTTEAGRDSGAARYAALSPGDPAPRFTAPSLHNPAYVFDTAAGRYLLLCFYGALSREGAAERLAAVCARRDLFDDSFAAAFGVTAHPPDAAHLTEGPGLRHFLDQSGAIARAYGALPANPSAGESWRGRWVLLDPQLRVIEVIRFADDLSDCAEIIATLAAQPPVDEFTGQQGNAPVLLLPRVFEPALCADLIAEYHRIGGVHSGFMRHAAGLTVGVHDLRHKSRRDAVIESPALRTRIRAAIAARVIPEIARAFAFNATRMERYVVCCYDAAEQGHFSAHRDNTTPATAHRRFAVSVNLSEGFEGGEVVFPEFAPRRYRAPAGGALVFSCALLHRVTPLRAGQRFVFLPFLYDEAAAKTRASSPA